jgi:hypothetical protein
LAARAVAQFVARPRSRCFSPASSVVTALVSFAGKPYRPVINPADFTHVVDNPYFPLVPGTTFTFVEKEGRETRMNRITVTHDTKMILGVKCVVVHDTVTLKGVLVEDTFDWYAQDKLGAVWYFGELTKEFKTGGRVSTAGSWEAGVKGALPGIMMPAHPQVGERYRMEFAANEAEDVGRIVALDETVTVATNIFRNCIRTREWSMLESGTSTKWYARGVGLVRAESTAGEVATLISVTRE